MKVTCSHCGREFTPLLDWPPIQAPYICLGCFIDTDRHIDQLDRRRAALKPKLENGWPAFVDHKEKP